MVPFKTIKGPLFSKPVTDWSGTNFCPFLQQTDSILFLCFDLIISKYFLLQNIHLKNDANFNFSVWGGPRVRKGTKLVSKTYTDGSTLYTADTSSKFPHENSATVQKDIDYLIVHKITGLSMSLPKNSDHQNYQYLLFFDSYTKLNYDLI